MSYHEYMDRRGNLITRRYNGKRYSAERLPLSDDDPCYEAQAMSVLQNLVDAIGKFEYGRWFEYEFEQGGDANRFTWRQMRDTARRRLEEIAAGECECTPDSAIVCPACAALLSQREIEF